MASKEKEDSTSNANHDLDDTPASHATASASHGTTSGLDCGPLEVEGSRDATSQGGDASVDAGGASVGAGGASVGAGDASIGAGDASVGAGDASVVQLLIPPTLMEQSDNSKFSSLR